MPAMETLITGVEDPILKLVGIEKSYKEGTGTLPILRGCDFNLFAGELTALVAPSGAGKSTLLHITGLLEKPDAGDVIIGGDIRPGFTVMGRHVTVTGLVLAARVRAMGNVTCNGGIQGGGKATLRAGRSLRARFCENAVLHAAQNILIDGSAMHCRLFAGEKLAVKGRLAGGEAYCGEAVYVGEQLGWLQLWAILHRRLHHRHLRRPKGWPMAVLACCDAVWTPWGTM